MTTAKFYSGKQLATKKSFKRRRPRQAAALLGFSMPKYARKAASGRFYVFCTNLTQPTGNLDSKSGGEVMELLQNVWKKMGKALVVIPHASRIARMADRQFQIVDGVLTEVTAK